MAEHKIEGQASLIEVRNYFGMTTRQFKEEWANGGLTDAEKTVIRVGIGNGTLTY